MLQCSACGVTVAGDDNYCRKCGMPVNVIDVPALRSEPAALSPWHAARPALARGVALVAAGALLRVLLGPVVRSALPLTRSGGGRGLLPFGDRESASGDEVEILWYRRVRR